MKLPKLHELKKKVSLKLFIGKGAVIRLHDDSEFLKAIPKLMDFVFDQKNSTKFNDTYKLQLEMRTLFDDLMKFKKSK
jgi:hypothetical protein